MTFDTFWNKNWKWILGSLGVIIAWLISGIIGYYTAIRTIDADITLIRERVTRSETKIGSTIMPQVHKIDRLSERVTTLESDFKFVKQETDIATRTNKSLEYLIEIERNKTVNELKEILKGK